MVENAIVVQNLTKSFGSLTAVNDVTFAVPPSSIFGFLGPNGSEKSTVIRMLCGILSPTSGSARVLDFDVRKDSEKIRENIGYMSQKFSLYSELSAYENITFYARLYGLKGKILAQRREEMMDLVGLTSRQDQVAGNLSGGWKQRLALACALVHDPKIVFLDEPTAGIDPVARRKLWDLIFQLSAQGVTFFVTTHYMDEAERCTQVGYIYLSNLIVCGMPDDLKSLPEITPQGYSRLEIMVANTTEVLLAVGRLPYVQDATIFGQSIHLLVSEEVSREKLCEELRQKGAMDIDVRPIRPTLEDVFVRLTFLHEQKEGNGNQGRDFS